MVEQDFDPDARTQKEFVCFCSRMELFEHTGKTIPPKQNPKQENNNNEKKRGTPDCLHKGKQHSSDKNCLLHGENCGHTVDDCFTLKKQAEELKKNCELKGGQHQRGCVNDKEVNALVCQSVKEAVTKALGESPEKEEDSHPTQANEKQAQTTNLKMQMNV